MTALQTKASPPDAVDFLGIDALLSGEERLVRDAVRTFVRERVLPRVGDWFEEGILPKDLARELGRLGLLGMHLQGYDCPGASAVAYGIACLELEAGDAGVRSFASVQGSLAMYAIYRWGTEEQKKTWLPQMASGETIGCFGLTEPDFGSNPAGMRTFAKRDGSDWLLSGTKMWITNGSIADIAIVWANTAEGIRGFIVETNAPGFSATNIHKKISLRASITSELVLQDVRLPAAAQLPLAIGLSGPLSCLNEARFGIVWGAMGAARACYESALDYAKTRVQFDRPIGSFQAVKHRCADMLVDVEGMRSAVYWAAWCMAAD
ncbi:MAG: acyl-CoA dehydrogenase family protein, partial [Candidatus Baltobacteraceae bacterium]